MASCVNCFLAMVVIIEGIYGQPAPPEPPLPPEPPFPPEPPVVLPTSFPLDLFFEATLQDVNTLFMSSSCDAPVYERCCYCDDSCIYYRRCCIDRSWTGNFSTMTQNHLDAYVADFVFQMENFTADKKLDCAPVLPGLGNGFTADTVFMITECPVTAGIDNSYLVDNCLNQVSSFDSLLHSLPVMGSDLFLYKNLYCALCHGITDYELLPLLAECSTFNVSADNTTASLDAANDCLFTIQSHLRKNGSRIMTSRCTESYETNFHRPHTSRDALLCDMYMSPAQDTSDGVWYRNVHCLWEKKGRLVNYTQNRCPDIIPVPITLTVFNGFTLTLSFASESKLQVGEVGGGFQREENVACPTGTVYDYFRKKCILVSCNAGFVPQGDQCIDTRQPEVNTRASTNGSIEQRLSSCLVGSQSSHFLLKIDVNITGSNLSSLAFISSFLHLNGSNFTLMSYSSLVSQHQVAVMLDHRSYPGGNPLVDYNALLRDMGTTSARAIVETLMTSSSVYSHSQLYGLDVSRSYPDGSVCYNRTVVNATRHVTNVTASCALSLDDTEASLALNAEYVSWLRLGRDMNQLEVSVCHVFHLKSPCLKGLIVNATISSVDGIATEPDNTTLLPTAYIPTRNGAVACIRNPPRVKESDLAYATRVITIIGCSLSAVAVVCLIFTYVTFPEFHTTPSNNLVCLSVALLISDVLLLSTAVVLDTHAYCKTVAVLLHWSLLVVYVWSAVIAYDLTMTFARPLSSFNAGGGGRSRFLTYAIVAWSLPTVVVVTCVIINETHPSSFRYGQYDICWIVALNGRIITYIVPVLTIMLFNIVALVYTSLAIWKTKRDTTKVTESKQKTDPGMALMFLKLCLILGAVEIIGIIQTDGNSSSGVTINETFTLIYSIVRSLRGFFLFLVFICKRRVFHLYRSRYPRVFGTHNKDDYSVSSTSTHTLKMTTSVALHGTPQRLQKRN